MVAKQDQSINQKVFWSSSDQQGGPGCRSLCLTTTRPPHFANESPSPTTHTASGTQKELAAIGQVKTTPHFLQQGKGKWYWKLLVSNSAEGKQYLTSSKCSRTLENKPLSLKKCPSALAHVLGHLWGCGSSIIKCGVEDSLQILAHCPAHCLLTEWQTQVSAQCLDPRLVQRLFLLEKN